MKNLSVTLCILTFLVSNTEVCNSGTANEASLTHESITVWSSPELSNLAFAWVEEYKQINPDARISILEYASDNTVSKGKTSGAIGFVTKEYLMEAGREAAWKMAVGRDVIVGVINAENPYQEELYESGISYDKFALAFEGTAEPTWGMLLGKESVNQSVSFYRMNDVSTQVFLPECLKTDQLERIGKDASNIDVLLEWIHSDRYAIGFCRLADILDPAYQEIDKRVMLIPIDANANNKIDHFENIYEDINDFNRGVWIGKYPRDFWSNIYAVSGTIPTDDAQLAFLEWVLGGGQQHLYSLGYSELVSSEKYNKVQSLYAERLTIVENANPPVKATTILVFLAVGLAGGILIFIASRFYRRYNQEIGISPHLKIAALNENSVSVPGGLFFDKSHTWAFMEKDGFARIGIVDFLQHVTGRITKIKMKTAGEKIKKGKPFISIIQDGKQLDINSPVSGTIKDCNEKLLTDSRLINASPYSDGWMYTVEPENWLMDIRTFLMGEKYRVWLKNEFARLKDFLFSTIKPDLLENSQVVLQDGGELRDNLLECLGPEDWEEFQSRFINTSE